MQNATVLNRTVFPWPPCPEVTIVGEHRESVKLAVPEEFLPRNANPMAEIGMLVVMLVVIWAGRWRWRFGIIQ